MFRVLFFILFSMIYGCSFVAPSYQASGKNNELIKTGTAKIRVSNITDSSQKHDSLACRAAGSVKLSDNKPFSDYIVNALGNELKKADLYSDEGVQLTAKIEKVNFSSAMGATNWYIDGTYEIDGEVIQVATVYHDRSSFAAMAACTNVAQYFQKAVEQHLFELYSNNIFANKVGYSMEPAEDDSSVEDRLHRLNMIREKGLINDEEYQEKRAKIIDEL